ncbi:MAG: SIMPL domain-containing protein [Geminicoccaceae bacterium]
MLRSLAFGALAVMALCAAPADAHEEVPRRIVVNGTGEASARPDMAVISAGVVVQADTASAALADNTRAMNAVLEQLRASGLPAEDVQTAQFSVTPIYERQRPEPETAEPPRVVGYQVSNQVMAQVRELDRLGAMLDALVGAGANSINGPWFEIADPKQLEGEARDAAVADAIAKARRYAAAAGVKLGEVISIEDSGSYAPPRPMMRAEAMTADVPIAPGQTELSASVTMVFAID